MDLHVDLIKGGMSTYGVERRNLHVGLRDPPYLEWIAFGVSVDLEGTQHYLDSQRPMSAPAITRSTT